MENQTEETVKIIASKQTTQGVFAVFDPQFRLLQPIWDLRIGHEDIVRSPLFPIIMSVGFYFLCMVPFMIFDLYGRDWKWIQKYKIQPNEVVTWPQVRKAIVLTLWNHLLYILPVSIAQWIWTPPTELIPLAPTVFEMVWINLAALTIFDFEYYVWHSTHHKIRFLYRHVHSIHHQYHAPSSWVTQYLHPWELISVGFFTTTSAWFFSNHPMIHWSFMLFSIIVSVEAHIGYDFPCLPHHWMPFWGGSIKHDMHHQRPLTNYQPFYNHWDRLFGTECPGQLAGGYKPAKLTNWEKKMKTAKLARLAEKEGYMKVLD